MTVIISAEVLTSTGWPPQVFDRLAGACSDAAEEEAAALRAVAQDATWFVDVQVAPSAQGVSAVLAGNDESLLAVATCALGIVAASAHRVVDDELVPLTAATVVDLPHAGMQEPRLRGSGPALVDVSVAARADQVWQEVRLLLWWEEGEFSLVSAGTTGEAQRQAIDIRHVAADLCEGAQCPAVLTALLVDVLQMGIAACD